MATHPKGVVLLVDDEDDLRDSLQDELEAAGYLVLAARDGVEALPRMRGLTVPTVAVIDLVMPRMNGWQLLEAMQQDSTLREIPVIVITAQDPPSPLPAGTRVVKKPFVSPRLRLTIDALWAERYT
ncbi:MAG TPA: response regulator [Kofleriaceae bacterium]|nr:response regulator [Kofleriaceae bacterium]